MSTAANPSTEAAAGPLSETTPETEPRDRRGLLAGAALAAALIQVPVWAVITAARGLLGAGFIPGAIPVLTSLAGVGLAVGALAVAAGPVGRQRSRAAGGMGLLGAGLLVAAGCLAAGLWGLIFAFAGSYVLLGATAAAVERGVIDAIPADARIWSFSVLRASSAIGAVAGMATARIVDRIGGSWRAVVLVAGLVTALAGAAWWLAAGRQGDRRPGRPTLRISPAEVRAALRSAAETGRHQSARLGRLPIIRRVSYAYMAAGACYIPVFRYATSRLEQRFSTGPTPAVITLVLALLPAAAGLGVLALRERRPGSSRGPAQLLMAGAGALGVAGAGILGVALLPFEAGVVVAWALASAALAAAVVAVDVASAAVAPAEVRGTLVATRMAGFWVIGQGLIGYQLLASLDRRFGVSGAVVVLAPVCGLIALVLRQEAGRVDSVMEGQAAEEAAAAEAANRRSHGELPMLACQGIDFSYGQVQVLFDVDFSVSDGEMVALLGTNGAGKSTLLRAISGLGGIQRGSVLFQGEDISFLPVEQRVGLGITQIPGGKAVFGPLTVSENLRMYGYTLGRSRRAVDDVLDTVFETFPRLAERRNQLAQTLSGGEQHMLGLARALLLQPRLLLIDELSLGLAPIIVGQLLDLVREINRRGSAVVVVEQSVNVALTLASHAYFMEKGQIRFDGRAEDLLDRRDLLRAVFLGGAAGHGASADGGPEAGPDGPDPVPQADPEPRPAARRKAAGPKQARSSSRKPATSGTASRSKRTPPQG